MSESEAKLIRCQACGAQNRLPTDLGDMLRIRCGRCKAEFPKPPADVVLYETASAFVIPWTAELRPIVRDLIVPDRSFQIQVALLSLFHTTLAYEGWMKLVRKRFDRSSFETDCQRMYERFMEDLGKERGLANALVLEESVSNAADVEAIRRQIARDVGKEVAALPPSAKLPPYTLAAMLIDLRCPRYMTAWQDASNESGPTLRLADRFYSDLTGSQAKSPERLTFSQSLNLLLARAHASTVELLSKVLG